MDDNHLNGKGAGLLSNHLADYLFDRIKGNTNKIDRDFYDSTGYVFINKINELLATNKNSRVYFIDISENHLQSYIFPLYRDRIKTDYVFSSDEYQSLDKKADQNDIVLIQNSKKNSELAKLLSDTYEYSYKNEYYCVFFNENE